MNQDQNFDPVICTLNLPDGNGVTVRGTLKEVSDLLLKIDEDDPTLEKLTAYARLVHEDPEERARFESMPGAEYINYEDDCNG